LRQWTFFGHFCAGESEKTIRPTIKWLESHGIGGILDYAAESDLEEQKGKKEKLHADQKPIVQAQLELAVKYILQVNEQLENGAKFEYPRLRSKNL
jgi:hypothetical protein